MTGSSREARSERGPAAVGKTRSRKPGKGRMPGQPRRGQQKLAFAAAADVARRRAGRAQRERTRERRQTKGQKLSRVPHRPRMTFSRTLPVHVTLRMEDDVWSMRSRRAFRRIEAAIAAARERFGMRLTHFSVQENHIHLIVEAENHEALSRGMQGLKIRIAKRLNAMMQRVGQVFSERFHAHLLRTPSEVRRAVNYVLRNRHKHLRERGESVPDTAVDPYAGGPEQRATAGFLEQVLAAPRTWLLAVGWKASGNRARAAA